MSVARPAILAHLTGVQPTGDGWLAFCPAHNDRNKRSLSINVAEDGKTLVNCHAQRCTADSIVTAAGAPAGILAGPNGSPRPRRREVATYDYHDERGQLLYQVVRFEPKDFRPRRPDGTGGWAWDLKGTRRVVYRLPELAEQTRVAWVEGEKDADRLWSVGIPATTSPSGSSSWRDEYAAQLAAAAIREVLVIPDNDEAGRKYAHAAAAAIARAGLAVRLLELPGLGEKGDVSDWLDAGHDANELQRLADLARPYGHQAGLDGERSALAAPVSAGVASSYIQPLGEFLSEDDTPVDVIFPDLLPVGVIMLLHGEPRARKSLAALELALAAATGTAPFGVPRFTPSRAVAVLYVQEEDPRSLTRPRLRALVQTRCGDQPPASLHVAVRRGINLDAPEWVAQLIADIQRLGVKFLVLDAARRLSSKTDEGPAKVRELVADLRSIVTRTGVTIAIVHHDVKPPTTGQDQRRRSQRASGGDWFAACECPVHIEKVGAHESLVFPEDYKFTSDPAPFTFTCEVSGGYVIRLVGIDTTSEHAEKAGIRGKVLDWLRVNGPATKTSMKKAGLGRWETIESALDFLQKDGKVDGAPGTKKGSLRFFVSEPSPPHGDDSPRDN